MHTLYTHNYWEVINTRIVLQLESSARLSYPVESSAGLKGFHVNCLARLKLLKNRG